MQPVNRLRPWQRRLCDATGALLLASGAVWLVVHYAWGAGAGELPHPLEAWTMKLHGLAAMASLFVLGLLSAAHVPHGWRLTRGAPRRGRRALGAGLVAAAALLAASGWLLYYLTPEPARPVVGGAHAAVGFAMALLLAAHRRR